MQVEPIDELEPAGASETTALPAAARYDVFLCHNSMDKKIVKDVADALQIEAGILFFLDEFSIPASVEFMQFIRDEMSKSAACAIFLGKNGWGKTHLVEAKLALELKATRPGFRIIPVNLPDAAEEWAQLFGAGHDPPYNWIEMAGAADDGARAKLVEAAQGRFSVKASGPEAITPYYIRRQAALWDKSGRNDRSLLIGGKLLRVAQAQASANPDFVSVNAVPAYLARCAQWERNRLMTLLMGVAGAAVVSGILALVAVFQRDEAVRQKEAATENARVSQVRSLASVAVRSIGEDRADERALLLSRQAYLLDRATHGQSSYIVTAALSEILATPYISSVTRLANDRIVERISPSGAWILSGENKTILTGPIIDAKGDAASRHDVEINVPIANFFSKTEGLVVATKEGDIETRTLEAPLRRERLVASLGKVPSILAVSRDGSKVTALTGDSDLTSMDLISTSVPKRWKAPHRVERLAISANGAWVAMTDARGTLRLYSWGEARPAATYPGRDSVNSFEFGRDNTLLVGERGGGVWSWNAKERTAPLRRLDKGEERGSIDVLAVSIDGTVAATASGAITPGIALWNVAAGKLIAVIPGPRSVAKLALTMDGRFLVSGLTSGEIRYWRLKGSGTSRTVQAQDWQPFPLPGRLYSVARNPVSDTFLVGGDHGVFQKWPSPSLEAGPIVLAAQRRAALETVPDQARFVSGDRNYLLTGHVMAIAFSKDGKRFATVDPYGYGLVWTSAREASQPALVQSSSTSNAAFSVALSPGGRKLVIGATSSMTFVHDLDDAGISIGKSAITSEGGFTVRALAFTDEDTVLVGDDSGRLVRWHLGKPNRPEILIAGGGAITSLSLSGDGKAALGRGDQVDLIDLAATSGQSTMLAKGLGGVYSVTVSDDSALLAAGFADGTVRIWSLRDPKRQPILLNLHRDIVRSLAFDRSGQMLVSVGDDGTIRSSVIGPERLASIACGVVWRDLDLDETRAFFTPVAPPILPTCSTPDR